MMLFKFGCRNPQNCLQRFNVCVNLANEQYDKQIISQLINLIGNLKMIRYKIIEKLTHYPNKILSIMF